MIFVAWSVLLLILVIALSVIFYQRKKIAEQEALAKQQHLADHNSFSFAERDILKEKDLDVCESSLESCVQGPPLET